MIIGPYTASNLPIGYSCKEVWSKKDVDYGNRDWHNDGDQDDYGDCEEDDKQDPPNHWIQSIPGSEKEGGVQCKGKQNKNVCCIIRFHGWRGDQDREPTKKVWL